MTTRTLVIDIDTELGNKLWWFLKTIMDEYPDAIKEINQSE